MFLILYSFTLFQWSGEPLNVPSPFKESSTALEQAFGLYEAAFCASTQLSPDSDSAGDASPPPDDSATVFEKQDSTTQMDRAASPPPFKRSRRCPHVSPELRQRRLGRPPSKSLPPETAHGKAGTEQSLQTQSRGRSSSEDRGILSQHHNAALCVCWICCHRKCFHLDAALMICIELTLLMNQVCHRPIINVYFCYRVPLFFL